MISGSMATTQIIGKVPSFDHTQNNWSIFENQMEQFLVANVITNVVKKKAILLTSLCDGSYMLLRNLVKPEKIEDAATTYDKCVQVMKKHFKVPTSGFAERYKFYNASKLSTETVNEWAVRVRSLAVNCEFGADLPTAIRYKFVMGLDKGPVRDEIFLKSVECSFDKAVEIANNTEYAKHQYDTVTVKEEQVNFIRKANGSQDQYPIN